MLSIKSNPIFKVAFGSLLVLGCLVAWCVPLHAKALPEFTQTSPEMWINSHPLTKTDVQGKVILIEIWTSV